MAGLTGMGDRSGGLGSGVMIVIENGGDRLPVEVKNARPGRYAPRKTGGIGRRKVEGVVYFVPIEGALQGGGCDLVVCASRKCSGWQSASNAVMPMRW